MADAYNSQDEKALALEIPTLYLDRPGNAAHVAEAIIGSDWLSAHDAKIRADALASVAELNEVFLTMRNRVEGYTSAPPVARQFERGGNAFEWAATNVRRALDGKPPLVPPVPIHEFREGIDSAEDGYQHYVLTCPECGTRFVCKAQVTIDHQVFESDPGTVDHYGRIAPAPSVTEADTHAGG